MSIEAMKQALEALEETESALARCMGPHKAEEGDRHRALAKSRTAITALRLAIEQAKRQEPVAYTQGHCKEKAKPGGCQLHNLHCGYPACDRKPVTAPPQQEKQEPVAWMTINAYGEEDDIYYENPEGKLLEGWTYKPLYTAPPQRQPLTEEQRQQRDGINSPNRGSLGGAHD